jgi:hypothetical protein
MLREIAMTFRLVVTSAMLRPIIKYPYFHLLTFLLFPFQLPSHSVGVEAGADCYVINFVRDNCFGITDTENWNKKFDREP